MSTLLTFQNAKTSKGESLGYLTGILYMAPANLVEGVNVCPMASQGCKKACLYSAGRGKFSNVQQARIRKTKLWRDNKHEFFSILMQDIVNLVNTAKKQGLKPIVRLNGTSDIPWESIKLPQTGKSIIETFPTVQFYDYTKNPFRLNKALPKNYDLTLSRSESNEKLLEQFVNRARVAVVFKDKLPKRAIINGKSYPVFNGDEHDLRFLNKQRGIVGLLAKGEAKKDKSGFVVNY